MTELMNDKETAALGANMDKELHSQPDVWARAIADEEQRKLLPAPGEKVAVIGCGTSWFVAQAYAALRESAGQGITDAYTATEVRDRDYDAYVAISRSGTTTEIAEFLKTLDSPARTIAILGDTNTPVAELAHDVIGLPFADEKSVVQTRFATTALMFLRASIEPTDKLEAVIEQARAALAQEVPAELIDAEQYTFLGSNFAIGLSAEAALKMRESAQAWTESYPAMEYRHGPLAIAAPGRVTWALGDLPEGLANDISATGATLVRHDGEDPIVELVRLHKVALLTARARGLDPDSPRHLTRSIILDK